MTKVGGEYVSTNEISRIVRTALRKRYGTKNVSVTKGSGTASGWIDARVEIPKPSECFCAPQEIYCSRCKEARSLTAQEARKIAYDAMKAAGAEFSSYYADDGYDTKSDCFLLDVRFIREQQ